MKLLIKVLDKLFYGGDFYEVNGGRRFRSRIPETDSAKRLETPFDHTYFLNGQEVKVSWEANPKTGEIYEVITPVKKTNIFQRIFGRR
jgi:hypothetical protein